MISGSPHCVTPGQRPGAGWASVPGGVGLIELDWLGLAPHDGGYAAHQPRAVEWLNPGQVAEVAHVDAEYGCPVGDHQLDRTEHGPVAPDADGQVERRTESAGDGKFAKVGRNAPCPCGSGRKYKRCHGDPRNHFDG